MARPDRKNDILQALARMLEANPGGKVTTASLAKEIGLSEAALYRHFPSKARMIEGLIEFAEETLFSRITLIRQEQPTAEARCHDILFLLLTFVERNPGFARLFVGDALQGETERLRMRTSQLMDRIETEIRQILREHLLAANPLPGASHHPGANLFMAFAEGRILQFARTNFRAKPTADWAEVWPVLSEAVFTNLQAFQTQNS